MSQEAGTSVPGEAEGSSLSPQVTQEAIETRATEKGWKPLDQFEGDPVDWVEAKEFVGRQKLYDRINDLKGTITKQTREFQTDMKQVLANMSKIRETEYKKALADLEAKREMAIEDDDTRAVVKVSKAIEKLHEEKASETVAQSAAAQTTAGPTPEFTEWNEKNTWFQTDSEMRADAISIGVGYAAGNPNKSQLEVLTYVTAKVKKMYPEKFEVKEKRQVDSKVEGANSGSARKLDRDSQSKTLTLRDLPEEHLAIAKTIIKSGTLKKMAEKNKRSEEAEYMAQYQGGI